MEQDRGRHIQARQTSPAQGDVLFVATASSVWSQELTFMRESIVAKINQALGGEYVKDVRFSEHLWGAQDGEQQRRDAMSPGGRQAQRETRGEDLQDSPREPLHPKGLGGEIGDSALVRALRKTAGAMMRRRRYLLANGFKLCETCGNIYPGAKSECPACRVKREFVAYNRAIAILDGRPYLGNQELSRLAGLPDTWLVEHARRELESRLVSAIRYRLGRSAGNASARGEAALLARKLASLRSQAPFEDLSPEDVERAIGRRLSTLLKKE